MQATGLHRVMPEPPEEDPRQGIIEVHKGGQRQEIIKLQDGGLRREMAEPQDGGPRRGIGQLKVEGLHQDIRQETINTGTLTVSIIEDRIDSKCNPTKINYCAPPNTPQHLGRTHYVRSKPWYSFLY